MAYSKVILNNATLMDVTDTTAVAGDVAQSKYFYGADGVKTEGTASGVDYLVQPQTFTATNLGSNYYYTSLADTPWDTEQIETITVVFDGTTYENVPFTGIRYGAPMMMGPDGAVISFSDYPFAIGSFLEEEVQIVVANNGQHTVSAVAGSGGGGGASNIVTGTFTTPSTNGIDTLETIPYTGNGYPIMAYFVIDGGAYVENTAWYDLVLRYAVGVWAMNKQDFSTTPTYSNNTGSDKANLNYSYKSSTSAGTNFSNGGASGLSGVYTFSITTHAQDTYVAANLVIRFPSATSFRYYTISTSAGGYGLAPSTTYRYWIVYSE